MKPDHSTCLCLLCCKVGDELTLAGETEAPPRLGCWHSVKKLQINPGYLSSRAFHTGSHLEEGWFATGVYFRPKNPRVLMLREPGHRSGVESLGYSDREGRTVRAGKPVTSKGSLDAKRKS